MLEWIPKFQNLIDTCFSGELFTKMVRISSIFHTGYNGKIILHWGRRGVCTNHVDKRGERGVAEMSTLLNNGCLYTAS